MFAPQGSLTLSTFDREVQRLGPLDLSNCGFTDAFGLVAIASAAETSASEGQTVVLTPRNDDVARYHCRMHLNQILEDPLGLSLDHYQVVHEHDQTDVLCELTRFDTWQEAESVADLVLSRISGPADVLETVWLCLTEACNNVTEHSERSGFTAAQVYEKNTVSERIVLAIGDAGIGIASSLGQSLGPLTNRAAVEMALEGGSSSSDDASRGYGIHDMADAIKTLNGFLLVRTGDGVGTVSRVGYRTSKSAAGIPGTLIGIQLPCV